MNSVWVGYCESESHKTTSFFVVPLDLGLVKSGVGNDQIVKLVGVILVVEANSLGQRTREEREEKWGLRPLLGVVGGVGSYFITSHEMTGGVKRGK
jgi:hypothetical protein